MTQLRRLLDEPGSDLDRVLLEAGLDEAPPKASLDRTLVALGVGSVTAIGAGALGAGAGAGVSLGGAKGLFGAGVVKWVAGALVATAAIGGGVFITQRAEQAPAPAVVAASPAAERIALQPPAAEAVEAPARVATPAETTREAPLEQQSKPAQPAEAVAAKETPVASKAEQLKPEQLKPEQLKPEKLKPEQLKPEQLKPEKGKADLTAGGGPLSDELKMLDSARRASLAGDSEGCLASLAKYKSKFPKGQMAAEADGMRAACAAKKQAAP